MRLLLIIALAVSCASCGGAEASVFQCRDRSRNCLRQGRVPDDQTSVALPVFAATAGYDWPQAVGRMNGLCTGDPKCIAWCAPGIFDGGCEAQCQANDGGVLTATITNPGTATCIPSFIPGLKALDISAGSQAPYAVSDELNVGLPTGAAGSFFTVALGRSDSGSTIPVSGMNTWQWDWTNPISVAAYYASYYDPANFNLGGVGFFNAPYVAALNQTSEACANYYGISWATIAGEEWDGGASSTTDIGIRGIGIVSEAAHGPSRHPLGSGYEHVWGANIARTEYLNGPWVGSGYYNAALSETEVRNVNEKLWGTFNSLGPAYPIVDATAFGEAIDRTADGGNVDLMWTLFPLTDATGALRSHRPYTNAWADDALDVTTWTNVGTPLVNTLSVANSFSYKYGVNATYELVDDSAAAFEGKRAPLGASDDGGLHWWSASCLWRKGTDDGGSPVITKARIAFQSTGGTIDGGSATCDFTGLSSTWSRGECRASYYGGTAMKADVLIGNAAADTGSVQVEHCQLTQGPALQPPWPTSARRSAYYYEVDAGASSVPTFSSGAYVELVQRALFNPVEVYTGEGIGQRGEYWNYALDLHLVSTSEHCVTFIYGETGSSRLFVALRDGHGVISDLITDIGGLTVGANYATRASWTPVGGGKCKLYVHHNLCTDSTTWDGGIRSCTATTLINSDTTGTATCPCQPERIMVGNRLTGDFPTDDAMLGLHFGVLQ